MNLSEEELYKLANAYGLDIEVFPNLLELVSEILKIMSDKLLDTIKAGNL